MKFFLTIIMCSNVAATCIAPHTFEQTYNDSYSCLLDGYKKSYEKIEEIGRKEINTHQIYLKFECHEFILPKPKPKIIEPKLST